MKKIEFETSKGRFVLIDNNQDNETVIDFLKKVDYGSYMNRIKLSEITEEEASEIVSFEEEYNRSLYGSAKNKLHSLLKSKGIYLFDYTECSNSFCDNGKIDIGYNEYFNCSICEEAEQKTFYNPYIFKL